MILCQIFDRPSVAGAVLLTALATGGGHLALLLKVSAYASQTEMETKCVIRNACNFTFLKD